MRSGANHLEVEVHVSFTLLRSVTLYVGTFFAVYPIVGLLLRSISGSPYDLSLPPAVLSVVQWLFAQLRVGWALFSAACGAFSWSLSFCFLSPSPPETVLALGGICLLWYSCAFFLPPAEAR